MKPLSERLDSDHSIHREEIKELEKELEKYKRLYQLINKQSLRQIAQCNILKRQLNQIRNA